MKKTLVFSLVGLMVGIAYAAPVKSNIASREISSLSSSSGPTAKD